MSEWSKNVEAELLDALKRLREIRELCKNLLRLNRGLPITMLDDGYLLDSDSLAQRILEVLGDE